MVPASRLDHLGPMGVSDAAVQRERNLPVAPEEARVRRVG